MPTEFLPPVDIGQVHLDCREIDRGQRVANCYAGMGIGGRIDDNAIIAASCFLNPGHQFPFEIRLSDIQVHSQILAEGCQGRVNRVERGRSINGLFPGPQQIEIWTVQDQHPKHGSYKEPPTHEFIYRPQ